MMPASLCFNYSYLLPGRVLWVTLFHIQMFLSIRENRNFRTLETPKFVWVGFRSIQPGGALTSSAVSVRGHSACGVHHRGYYADVRAFPGRTAVYLPCTDAPSGRGTVVSGAVVPPVAPAARAAGVRHCAARARRAMVVCRRRCLEGLCFARV